MIPFGWALAIVCGIVLLLIAGLCVHGTASSFVRNNAEGIKIALLIGAALYTAWIYDRESTDNRIANTLAFKERAETGALRRAFHRIDMLWIRSDATQVLEGYRLRVANTSDPIVENDLHKEFADFTGELVESRQLQGEIFAIHGFYRDIKICVEQGRCHAPTACQLFAGDMQNFRTIYVRFLQKWDKLWQTGVVDALKGFSAGCSEHLHSGRR